MAFGVWAWMGSTGERQAGGMGQALDAQLLCKRQGPPQVLLFQLETGTKSKSPDVELDEVP